MTKEITNNICTVSQNSVGTPVQLKTDFCEKKEKEVEETRSQVKKIKVMKWDEMRWDENSMLRYSLHCSVQIIFLSTFFSWFFFRWNLRIDFHALILWLWCDAMFGSRHWSISCRVKHHLSNCSLLSFSNFNFNFYTFHLVTLSFHTVSSPYTSSAAFVTTSFSSHICSIFLFPSPWHPTPGTAHVSHCPSSCPCLFSTILYVNL